MDTKQELTPVAPASMLTAEEANFVYNAEIIGMPVKKAAEMAGLPLSRVVHPHIIQAREEAKRELRRSTAITREDVVNGLRDAIWRAQLVSDPVAEIKGWEAISKLLGLEAAKEVNINLKESVRVVQAQLHGMSTDELVDMLNAGDIIDGEFYVSDAADE